MPIILKGVTTWEDAVLAAEAGVQGIVVSNHGGRQLDTAPSGLEALVEITTKLRERGLWPNPKFEIFMDGGVKRATDVLKAIALGASGVGIGRGFLYSFCAYGQEGVEHAFDLLNDEFQLNMRLLGVSKLSDLQPGMVNTSKLYSSSESRTYSECAPFLCGTDATFPIDESVKL